MDFPSLILDYSTLPAYLIYLFCFPLQGVMPSKIKNGDYLWYSPSLIGLLGLASEEIAIKFGITHHHQHHTRHTAHLMILLFHSPNNLATKHIACEYNSTTSITTYEISPASIAARPYGPKPTPEYLHHQYFTSHQSCCLTSIILVNNTYYPKPEDREQTDQA